MENKGKENKDVYYKEMEKKAAPLICALLHCAWHSRRHQLVECLERVCDGQAVGEPVKDKDKIPFLLTTKAYEPGHNTSICALIHLAGKKQRVTPKATPHCKLQTFSLVPMQQIIPEP